MYFRTSRASLSRGYVLGGGDGLATVAALGGDSVRLNATEAVVTRDGKTVARLGVPALLGSGGLAFRVPEGHCFCVPHALLAGRRVARRFLSAFVRRVLVLPVTNIEGRVFMVYNPITKRRFLPRTPAGNPAQARP